jgi:hypothetical protein
LGQQEEDGDDPALRQSGTLAQGSCGRAGAKTYGTLPKKGRTGEIPLLKVVTEPVAILQAWKDETLTQW